MKDKRDMHERLVDKIENGTSFFSKFLRVTFFLWALAIMTSLSVLFNNVARKIQSSTLSDSNSVLFVPGKATNSADFLVFISSILYIFIWMIFKFNFNSRKMKIIFNCIVSIMLIGNILYTVNSSYNYYDITKEQIIIRENRDSVAIVYKISDISYVLASYRVFDHVRKSDTYHLVYKVTMKNGIEFDLADSPDFERNIMNVDNILQNNNIEILRDISAEYFLYEICGERCSNDILKIYGVTEGLEN